MELGITVLHFYGTLEAMDSIPSTTSNKNRGQSSVIKSTGSSYRGPSIHVAARDTDCWVPPALLNQTPGIGIWPSVLSLRISS